MEEKQINKWLRRRFSAVGWALVVYYLILNILVSLTMAVDAASRALRALAAGRFPGDIDVDALMGNAWGYILAIAVGAVVLYAWKGGDYCREEILAKEKPMTASGFFAVLSLTVGAQLVNSLWVGILEVILNAFGRSTVPMLENVSGASDTVSMFLYAGLLAPIAEEVLFRGLMLRSLKPFGKRFAILGPVVRRLPWQSPADSLCLPGGPGAGLCDNGVFHRMVHSAAHVQQSGAGGPDDKAHRPSACGGSVRHSDCDPLRLHFGRGGDSGG